MATIPSVLRARRVLAKLRMAPLARFSLRALFCALMTAPAQPQIVGVRAASVAHSPNDIAADALREAARRFQVPVSWLSAVMRTESAGDATAASKKGAIGLMQIMPDTYAELRARHGLGPDPFDPRDNILAGTAYLAEMRARYGAPGFLAAYNAGPRRYEEHLLLGRPLPSETQDYVARLAPELGFESVPTAQNHASFEAMSAPIFVAITAPGLASEATPSGATNATKAATPAIVHPLFSASANDKIFIREAHSDAAPKAPSGAEATQAERIFVARGAGDDAR
jgi:hypothetical protein